MNTPPVSDTWARGNPYEQYIGRWSRRMAPLFLAWMDPPAGQRWLDVGCGTDALSAAILDHCRPSSLVGVEPSEGFLQLAARNLAGQARFLAGDAAALPLDAAACDVVVSGLVLNFVPALPAALAEMQRVAASGGTIAAYVWTTPMAWRSSGPSGTLRCLWIQRQLPSTKVRASRCASHPP
ncbi:MAG: class I SAM-dependent methyltransferase [Hydrogenophaga sp.]|nr:class I SAM-dependent methyltransferase [Hydrogenophaga sp.]